MKNWIKLFSGDVYNGQRVRLNRTRVRYIHTASKAETSGHFNYTSSDSFILLGQFTLCIDFAARKGQSCWIQQDRKPAESLVCPEISA